MIFYRPAAKQNKKASKLRAWSLAFLHIAPLVVATAVGGFALPASPVVAQVTGEAAEVVKQKIANNENEIKNLEAEIAQFQKQIDVIGKSADSLKNTLAALDLTQKKLNADILLSQKKIAGVEAEIKNLSKNIGTQTERIEEAHMSVSKLMKILREHDDTSIVEALAGNGSLAERFAEVDSIVRTTSSIDDAITNLRTTRTQLQDTKTSTESKRKELLELQADLAAQRKIVLATAAEKKDLLVATKNQESSYRALVADKQRKKQAFEDEINAFEASLKLNVSTSLIPTATAGVLKYPVDKVIITQYFGNTAFSTQNPQIYNGKGHTGIDLGVPVGTAVKAAMGGVVAGSGNTDLVKGCYSYGKWVMIKHPNGLSTLYAHLSVLGIVNQGDPVVTGQIIGYSGNTGYSTGPHLHFTVYATEGVRIQQFSNSVNCKNAVIPVADFKAYLNPLSYL